MRIMDKIDTHDKEYCIVYYPTNTRLKNRGGLSLVASTFIPLGFMIMNSIRSYIDELYIIEDKKDAISNAWQKIFKNTDVWNI